MPSQAADTKVDTSAEYKDPQFISGAAAPESVEPESAPVAAPTAQTRDPRASIGNTILAIGGMHNQAEAISSALAKHLPAAAAEPELHGFLHRIHLLVDEFRAAVLNIENDLSERLRAAIEQVAG